MYILQKHILYQRKYYIFLKHYQNEFDKNANFVLGSVRASLISARLVWRLIGVCVFCAAASVVALFILEVFYDKYMI